MFLSSTEAQFRINAFLAIVLILVSHGPYNWLTQNSLEPSSSFATDSSSDDDSGRSLGQSSLLFTIGRSSRSSAKKLQPKPVGADFGKERLGKKVKQDDGIDYSLFICFLTNHF